MSVPTILSLDALTASEFHVTKPELVSGEHHCFVYANNQPGYVFFTLNKANVVQQEGRIVVDHPSLAESISTIERTLAQHMHENSQQLFDGKRFSLNKILASNTSIVSEAQVTLNLHPQCTIKDQFGTAFESSSLTCHPKSTIVVCLSGITFDKASWKLNLDVHQLKLFQVAKVPEWVIPEVDVPLSANQDDPASKENDDDCDFLS